MSEQDTAVEIVFDQPEPEQAKTEQEPDPVQTEEPADEAKTETASEEKLADKTFTQAELDEILQKRLAKLERKHERERIEAETRIKMMQEQQPQVPADDPEPKESDYETYSDYLKDLAKHEARQILRAEREAEIQKTARQSQQSEAERYAKLQQAVIENGEAKYDDFEDVVAGTGDMLKSKGLSFSKAMVSALIEADNAADIAYHLGKNLDEAERIAALPAYAQAKEIGKLEDKLSAKPATKTSKAPEPITPVTGSKALTKSIEDMSVQEFEEYGRKRGAIWAR